MDLATALRGNAVDLSEVEGWRARGDDDFAPIGVIVHHTAGRDSLRICINGRPGIPGPLCQFLIAKSGKVHLIAAGRANHAGRGSGRVLYEVQHGIAPTGTARERNLSDTEDRGNYYFWGIEVENLGDGRDPYPPAQIEALMRVLVTLSRFSGLGPNAVIHHKEWTARKSDMSWTGDVRGLLRARLTKPPVAEEDDEMAKLVKMQRADGTIGPELFLDDGIHIRWVISMYEAEELLAQGHKDISAGRPVHEIHVRQRRVFVGPKPACLA